MGDGSAIVSSALERNAPGLRPETLDDIMTSVEKPKCSVVIPVYKSECFLRNTIDRTVAFFEGQKISYEIILVNDGSPDGVWGVIESVCESNTRIIGVNLLKNYGQHSALLQGFSHAKGTYIVTIDDDLQNPPEEIAHLIEKVEEGHDLVFGRFRQKKHSLFRRCGTKLINWMNGKAFGKPKDLVLSNFRIAHHSVIQRILELDHDEPYLQGLFLMSSSSVANVWVEHHARSDGTSNYTLGRIAALTARLLFNHSTFPIRAIGVGGIVVSTLSLLVGIVFLSCFLTTGSAVPSWAMISTVISFFAGTILCAIGVVGEYLVRLVRRQSGAHKIVERESING